MACTDEGRGNRGQWRWRAAQDGYAAYAGKAGWYGKISDAAVTVCERYHAHLCAGICPGMADGAGTGLHKDSPWYGCADRHGGGH